jgi:hypothetical protein
MDKYTRVVGIVLLFVSSLILMSLSFVFDETKGSTAFIINSMSAFAIAAWGLVFIHYGRKLLTNYPVANLEQLGKKSINTATGAGLFAIAIAIIVLALAVIAAAAISTM